MSYSTPIERYFFRRQYAVWTDVEDDWWVVTVGERARGSQLTWAVRVEAGVVMAVRYRVYGGVLLVACCARAAEYCENKAIDQCVGGLTQDLVDFFAVAPTHQHIPGLLTQAVSKAHAVMLV